MNTEDHDSRTVKDKSGQREAQSSNGKSGQTGDRQARQAEALRANLRKRKAQTRARRKPAESGPAVGRGENEG